MALGRVLLAVLVLVDLAVRAQALEAHYSDAGVLPREAYQLSHWDQLWSLNLLSGDVLFQALLFAGTAISLVFMALGIQTRIANLIAWLLYASICARNPFLRDGQDELGRLLLLFGLFLPWDIPWKTNGQVRNLGTFAFTAQVCVIYWASVIHKLLSPWWQSGEALSHVIQMRRYQTVLAQSVDPSTTGLHLVTYAAVALELVGPIVLLTTWRKPLFRTAVVVAMISLHLGMALLIRIGTFPALCIALWLMFLPSRVWARETSIVKAQLPQWKMGTVLFALVLVLWVNVQNLLHLRAPHWVEVLPRALAIQQWWGVFAPSREEGAVTDGWFWAQGKTPSGDTSAVSLPWVTSSETPPAQLKFQSVRWRHLLANVTTFRWPKGSAQAATQASVRQNIARWMCREWNRTHPPNEQLQQLHLFFFRHQLGKPTPVTRELLGSGDDACLENVIWRSR